jgi:hypothetical protein
VDPTTVNHLQIAARNRDLARALLDPALAGLRPTPWEWVAVIAFYAAVHYANAYLWETSRLTSRTHRDRRHSIENSAEIGNCAASYGVLQDAGFRARYVETYTLEEQRARSLLNTDLRLVEATVMQALGQPAPIW